MRCISFCVTQQLLDPWIDSHGTSGVYTIHPQLLQHQFSTSGSDVFNFRLTKNRQLPVCVIVYIPQASSKSVHGFGRSSCVTHKMKCLWYQYENYRNFSTFRNRKNIHKILLRRLEMKFKKRVRNLTIIWAPILNPYSVQLKMGQLGNSIILQIQKFLSKKRTRF